MARASISLLAHAEHPIAAPLDDESVRRLIDRAVLTPADAVLDLGCGQAAWLLRILTSHHGVRGEGVDIGEEALERARARAVELGVADRLKLHQQDATAFAAAGGFDVVLSVGAAHAFGGLLPTLDVAATHLVPGGRVIIGDAFWDSPPSARAREVLGEYEDLAATIGGIVTQGWTPVFGHISTRRELDDYEWCWTGSLAGWALDHPDDPDSAELLAVAASHRDEWLHGYRDSFGFLTAVLRRTGS
jgi:SAM-dependent methyltransferase